MSAAEFDQIMNQVLEACMNYAGKSGHLGALPEHEAMAYLELCQLAELWARYNRMIFEINIQKMTETQHNENLKHQKWRAKHKPEEPNEPDGQLS